MHLPVHLFFLCVLFLLRGPGGIRLSAFLLPDLFCQFSGPGTACSGQRRCGRRNPQRNEPWRLPSRSSRTVRQRTAAPRTKSCLLPVLAPAVSASLHSIIPLCISSDLPPLAENRSVCFFHCTVSGGRSQEKKRESLYPRMGGWKGSLCLLRSGRSGSYS